MPIVILTTEGPSGVGKSTDLNILAKIIDPSIIDDPFEVGDESEDLFTKTKGL